MKEIKSIVRPIEEKAEREDGTLHIRAYACVFGNVDSYGDIIAENACDAFLKSADAERMKLCYQHDMQEVIGVITDKGVDAIGMWIEADILPTTTGKDVQTLMKAGAIDEFSIGYWANEYHYEKREGYPQELRILDAITILEVSPVTRAANPKAVVLDMKNDLIGEKAAEDEQETKPQTQEEKKPLNEREDMEEMKEMLKAFEQKAAAAEKAAAEKDAALKTAQENINNLDASVKAQEQKMAELRKMIAEQPKTFAKAMREALDTKKAEIENFIKGTGSFCVEFKVASTDLTGAAGATILGQSLDPSIHAVPVMGNAFLLAFRNVTAASHKITWVEASTAKNVGYVDELAENTSKTAVTFTEKQRKLAKVATYMELSSELENWYEVLYDFCVAEGQRIILKDVDAKVWNGQGGDAKPKEIVGIKENATAFAKLGSYANPHVGDVIVDAIAQIKKAGFSANVAIVSYATMAELRGVKNAQGNYIYNEVTGMFGQVKVYESEHLTDEEILVADNYCAEVHMGNLYELEFTRKASTDSWRVDLRRQAQVKIPTPKAKGLIYVADKAAAITAITK